MDPRLGTDFPYISGVMGGGFPPYNALAKIDVATGKHEVFSPAHVTWCKSACSFRARAARRRATGM
jgi:hypothetical protein